VAGEKINKTNKQQQRRDGPEKWGMERKGPRKCSLQAANPSLQGVGLVCPKTISKQKDKDEKSRNPNRIDAQFYILNVIQIVSHFSV